MVVQKNNYGICKMRKALVIGNGPSCLEHKFGEQIDSGEFGSIFRINRGYKQDDGKQNTHTFDNVGQKTDTWVCSDLRAKLAFERRNELKKILIYFPKFKYNQNYQSTIPNVEILHSSLEDTINSLVNFKPQWPSTGIIALMYAIENYDKVTIHGFDTYDFKYDTVHFFEDKPNKYKFSNNSDHSCTSEKTFLSLVQEQYNVKQLKDII